RLAFSNIRRGRPFSPWGEGAPQGRMRGPLSLAKKVAPHQFGRMTYDRALDVARAASKENAIVSHGLTSSPPQGEAAALASPTLRGWVAPHYCSCWRWGSG